MSCSWNDLVPLNKSFIQGFSYSEIFNILNELKELSFAMDQNTQIFNGLKQNSLISHDSVGSAGHFSIGVSLWL